ncbi:hypothetical protein Vretifemale_17557, partial [Volvox reticuliferus]
PPPPRLATHFMRITRLLNKGRRSTAGAADVADQGLSAHCRSAAKSESLDDDDDDEEEEEEERVPTARATRTPSATPRCTAAMADDRSKLRRTRTPTSSTPTSSTPTNSTPTSATEKPGKATAAAATSKAKVKSQPNINDVIRELERTRALFRRMVLLMFGLCGGSLLMVGAIWVAYMLGRLQTELATAMVTLSGLRGEIQKAEARWQASNAALMRDWQEQRLLLELPSRRAAPQPGCVIC